MDQSNQLGASSASLFLDQLRHNDLSIRLRAFGQLTSIAKVLGVVRTREELIPYMNEFIDDEDEVLLLLTRQLYELKNWVGGVNFYFHFFPVLENIFNVEEELVRDNALGLISDLAQHQPFDHVVNYAIPLVQRLSLRLDCDPARMSASRLCHCFYPLVDVQCKTELRRIFVRLCQDNSHHVRKTACREIEHLFKYVDFININNELLVPFCQLVKDENDSVRLSSIQSCVALVHVFQKEHNYQNIEITNILSMIIAFCHDKSWKIRSQVANLFCDLYKAVAGLKKEKSSNKMTNNNKTQCEELVHVYAALLKDIETEVRTLAAYKIGEVAILLGGHIITKILLHPISTLVNDKSHFVRAALATNIFTLSKVVNKKKFCEQVLPLILHLLKDHDSTVRLNIISKFETVNEIIGIEIMARSLLPSILQLAIDKKWRIRLAVINLVPPIAKQMGPELFQQKINELCLNWLADRIFSIREAATKILPRLIEIFGMQWGKIHIFPSIMSLASHRRYLYRVTALLAIREMICVIGSMLCQTQLFSIVLKMAIDSVPNVRFNACKTLTVMLPQLAASIYPQIQHAVARLKHDSDPDVQFHFQELLAAMPKCANVRFGNQKLPQLQKYSLSNSQDSSDTVMYAADTIHNQQIDSYGDIIMSDANDRSG